LKRRGHVFDPRCSTCEEHDARMCTGYMHAHRGVQGTRMCVEHLLRARPRPVQLSQWDSKAGRSERQEETKVRFE
jgi:hypothetical protein